jgi:hypothetical protein
MFESAIGPRSVDPQSRPSVRVRRADSGQVADVGSARPRTRWRRRTPHTAADPPRVSPLSAGASELGEVEGAGHACVVVADPRGLFANRIWVQPGAQEIPILLPGPSLVLQLRPVDLPDGGLLLSLEVRRGGRGLASCRLKGAGAARDVALALDLPRGSAGRRATLCIRSNAELHLQF